MHALQAKSLRVCLQPNLASNPVISCYLSIFLLTYRNGVGISVVQWLSPLPWKKGEHKPQTLKMCASSHMMLYGKGGQPYARKQRGINRDRDSNKDRESIYDIDISIYMYISLYLFIYLYIYLQLYISISICISICIFYIYRQINRQIDRQRKRDSRINT